MTSDSPGDSFDARFDDLAAIAYRVAYRLLGSRADAEDIAQEALTRAHVRWRRVHRHAEPWVARVATNLAIDAVRRGSRRGGRTLSPADAIAARASPSATDRIELQRLVAGLPRRQREVVALRYLADMTEAATAAELGTSIGTVKQHAHRGLAALRLAWDELDPESTPTPTPEPGGS